MKNTIKILAALAVLGFSGSAFAQASGTANGTANATIIAPIAVVPVNTLSFGNIIAGSGVVTEANNAVTPTSAYPATQHGTQSDQKFEVTGAPGYSFNMRYGTANSNPPTVVMNGTTAGHPITVTLTDLGYNITGAGVLSTDGLTSTGNATIGAGGQYWLYVGGNFQSNDAVSDSYSGTFPVTVAYN